MPYPGSPLTATELPPDITDDTDSKAGTPRTGQVGFLAGWMRNVGAEVLGLTGELGADAAGTFATVKARLDALQTCRKTSDLAFTTQTLTNVTEMALVFAANSYYRFAFDLAYSAGTARGIGLGLTLGGTITRLHAGVQIFGYAADGTAATFQGVINSSGDSVIGAQAQTGNQHALIRGIAVMGATGGTLQLQARQGTGGTAANATVHAGSFGEAYLN